VKKTGWQNYAGLTLRALPSSVVLPVSSADLPGSDIYGLGYIWHFPSFDEIFRSSLEIAN